MDIRRWHNKYSIDIELIYNSEATQKNYKSQVYSFLVYFQNEVEPKAIPNEKIKLWLLQAQTINTRKHRLCAINSFYKYTVGMPAKIQRIPYPKSERKLPKPVEASDIKKMLDICQNLKHKSIINLLYGCGLRISEVINLRPEHIDSKGMIINIIAGKGKKDRIVMLPEKVLTLLREYFIAYKPKEYLFNGQKSIKYSQRSVNQFLQSYAIRAGLRDHIHAHLLRHSFASHSLEGGTDISYVQKLLGHGNIKTTMIYTHVSRKTISNIKSPINWL